jgi:hypothetical protein
MAHIVEKPDGTIVVLVHLSLKPDRDEAIIQLLRSAPKGGLAGIVREAMRTGIGENHSQDLLPEEEPLDLPDLGIDL